MAAVAVRLTSKSICRSIYGVPFAFGSIGLIYGIDRVHPAPISCMSR